MNTVSQIPQSAPSFLENMQLLKNNIFASLNCHLPGKIIAFDAETQTCTVQIMPLKYETLAPAPITQVPLIMLGAGSAHITMPNPVGTTCLLLFMDRNMDAFMETGEAYSPTTSRMHDFTDCVALTTFKTLVDPIKDYDEEAVTIRHESEENDTKNEAFIKVYPDEILLQAQTTSPDATETAGIGINEVVNVFNHKYNLGELMGAFLTACENITVDPNTGVLSPTSKQAFTDLKEQFGELLG